MVLIPIGPPGLILRGSKTLKPVLNCFYFDDTLFKFILTFLKIKIYNDNFHIKDFRLGPKLEYLGIFFEIASFLFPLYH